MRDLQEFFDELKREWHEAVNDLRLSWRQYRDPRLFKKLADEAEKVFNEVVEKKIDFFKKGMIHDFEDLQHKGLEDIRTEERAARDAMRSAMTTAITHLKELQKTYEETLKDKLDTSEQTCRTEIERQRATFFAEAQVMQSRAHGFTVPTNEEADAAKTQEQDTRSAWNPTRLIW